MARKKIVAGNWKMNMTPSQAVKLVEELKPLVVSDDVEVTTEAEDAEDADAESLGDVSIADEDAENVDVDVTADAD